jgi:hypothetical protein
LLIFIIHCFFIEYVSIKNKFLFDEYEIVIEEEPEKSGTKEEYKLGKSI